ncbi:hypothetical protein NIES2100_43060 [Calothrix sp. NIES-2100]|nr:hypothetical protein NIES2100_43060 [Calothrix sp. NIES-2100]
MNRYRVVNKRIVSPDGKTIAEVKSFVKASGDDQSEVSQSISVSISSEGNASIYVNSSSISYSSSTSSSCSQSGFSSISIEEI